MLQITNPQPFQEALDSRAVKTLLPTTLRTAAMDTLPADIRERAFWSAGVTNAEFLQEADDVAEDILTGKINYATGRQRLDALRAKIDPEAEARFQAEGKDSGDLTDLWSERRQNVLLQTNVQMAQGYGDWIQGMAGGALDQFPAAEFVRLESRLHPRDESPDPENHWDVRWQEACQEAGDLKALSVFQKTGRMAALKTSGVWTALSRFGLPYAPFDFNSGMGLEDVDRDEAEELGLIKPEDVLTPQSRGFNDDFQMTPEVRAQNLLSALTEIFKPHGLSFADGVFTSEN